MHILSINQQTLYNNHDNADTNYSKSFQLAYKWQPSTLNYKDINRLFYFSFSWLLMHSWC